MLRILCIYFDWFSIFLFLWLMGYLCIVKRILIRNLKVFPFSQVIEEDLLLRINEIREKLEKAEDVEEADLLEKERVIMERRAARMKVSCSRLSNEEYHATFCFFLVIEEMFAIVFQGRRSP